MDAVEEFRAELESRFQRGTNRGASEIAVNSGDLHRSIGGYPSPKHRMPQCCDVMYDLMRTGDEIVSAPPKGKGASLTIKYKLPR